MNKIIWKDIDSSTIKGLLICELPPITKPKMRVQETEVDGVDGSIIEELGYESYDKSIRIGLTRNFDIDEVIKYFTGEGNVVFSNEPNKYYKAKIIDQIDYTRLLRFKEAVVTFRVQPFKYEYEEEEQITATGSAEGTEIKIIDAKATQLQVDGRSTQDGTPTPDTPVEIESVGTYNEETGKYGVEVKTVGKNKFDEEMAKKSSNYTTNTNIGSSWRTITIDLLPNTEYTITRFANNVTTNGAFNLQFYLNEDSDSLLFYVNNSQFETTLNRKTETFTTGESGKIYLATLYGNDERLTNLFNNIDIQIEEGNVSTEFKKYKSNKSVLELDKPLRSLPNGVKDIAYIKNNKLYVDRYVGSRVFDGSESDWVINNFDSSYTRFLIPITDGLSENDRHLIYSNYFHTYTSNTDNSVGIGFEYGNKIYLYPNSDITTISQFQTWLSTHNTEVIYELATSVTEEYGDLTILDLVDGENNISNSADTNMVVDYVDNKLIINNLGNYTSKPTFEIEGAGTIKFILNGYSVFTYNFDDDGRVVIDSEKEDAYLDTVLKNRNMNGEFPKLEIGENIITWDGLVKSMKVVKKSRWL